MSTNKTNVFAMFGKGGSKVMWQRWHQVALLYKVWQMMVRDAGVGEVGRGLQILEDSRYIRRRLYMVKGIFIY